MNMENIFTILSLKELPFDYEWWATKGYQLPLFYHYKRKGITSITVQSLPYHMRIRLAIHLHYHYSNNMLAIVPC